MSERAEQFREVRQMLEEAAKYLKVPITGKELDTITTRLMPLYGKELFSTILAIANNDIFFPSGWELENRVRKAMGKPAIKGFTPDLIDKNVEELVRSGVPREVAEKGARFLKANPSINPPPPPVLAISPTPNPDKLRGLTIEAAFFPDDGLDDLEDFGDAPAEDPLAGLEDFGEPENSLAGLEEF